MRALRKIVFVNSANIRYSEIKLDGNVHYIGTQGVGKSTLLRAILFFYNADKLHLGIPKEMKSFDEFYLPHANSYIVYEVEHEHGPFSILVFRSSGRACYRFVDAPFNRKWLIDDHGEVTSEIKTIRARIGNAIYISKLIDKYEQYKEIIYGHEANKELVHFRIMESRNYQNVSRSIQNVFLNSRLDANFIKDIIIRSMDENEASVNLGYYRTQLVNFEQEYRDISCWSEKDQKGNLRVVTQADNVIKTHYDLIHIKKEIEKQCGELHYSIRAAKERIPVIEEKLNKLNNDIEKQEKILSEENTNYKNEKSELDGIIAIQNNAMAQIIEKKNKYESHKIDSIITRCEQESVVRAELDSLKQRLVDLTAKYNDVTTKYKTLISGLNSQMYEFNQQQNSRKIQLRENLVNIKEKLNQEKEINRSSIESTYSSKVQLINDRIVSLQLEKSGLEKSKYELKYYNPYKAQIDDIDKQIVEYEQSKNIISEEIKSLDAEGKKIQAVFEKKEAELVSECHNIIEKKEIEIGHLSDQIKEIDALLNNVKGSLYEWLCDNKKDWESNIGKVIDEENILYKVGLHPEINGSDANTLYGVTIDLSDVKSTMRNPDELKKQKTNIESEVLRIRTTIKELNLELDEKMKSNRAKYTDLFGSIQEQKAIKEAELSVIPNRIKTLSIKQQDIITRTKQEQDKKSQEIESNLAEVSHNMAIRKEEVEKLFNQKNCQIKNIDEKYRSSVNELDILYKKDIDDIDNIIMLKEKDIEKQISILKGQELEELKGKGADTKVVEDCNFKISSLTTEIDYIEKNREIVYNYRKDKVELFDREKEFKTNKKDAEEKLQLLDSKYNQRMLEYKHYLNELKREVGEYIEQKKQINSGLSKADSFTHDDKLCPSFLYDIPEKTTNSTPEDIVDELTRLIVTRRNKQDSFRENINLFKANFSSKNTFNFKTDLNTDDDYYDFARNLSEFVHNNLIEQYRKRTSERYVEILSRISSEMGELTSHESDVERIINEINDDFEKKNFAGVINLISLRVKKTETDKMAILMHHIKSFHDENQFNIGEVSLFSSDNRTDVNNKAVDYILQLMKELGNDGNRHALSLSDLFQLQFRVKENDNDTGWVDKLSHVGSEGTDTLVKAMVNIMLINVFKTKGSRKFNDFKVHCMMDEIGKLHPQNIKGILDFANARNILLINSSPTTYNVSDYRYTYLLQKDGTKTVVSPLISQ